MATWMDRFLSPDTEYRPKVRYWMPHSFVSEEGLARDVADLAARGFGGVEANDCLLTRKTKYDII